MPEFRLPDLGEGVSEAEIDRWLVKEGDVIAEDEPLLEVITDKATAEIPSPYAGPVSAIHVQAGEVVPVGTVLVTIGEASSPGAQDKSSEVQATHASELTEIPAPPEASAGDSPTIGRTSREIKAMPLVRKLARDLGVDLTAVTGSGPDGRILREDVEAYAAAQSGVATAPVETGEGASPAQVRQGAAVAHAGESATARREPLRGIRRTIAERMSEAHRIVPAVTHVEECDVTELEKTRKLANERAAGGPRLTFLPFIVKAVVAGLKSYPALNASLDEDADEIVYHDRYDIGIAVDTPAGLTVPVVRDADNKTLREIAREIDELAVDARSGKLKSDQLRGGTFTITSPGPFGGLMATPLVFHPQSAILGVHRAAERPVVRDAQIVIRKMMNLSITFDHRVLDGMTAAKFALEVVELLEHPAVLALEG